MDSPIRLHWLDPRDPQQAFPPTHLAMREPNGLLAIGGDLSLPRLLRAYSQGIFPWYNPDEPILWWCPNPRAILSPSALHISRSLQRAVTRQDYAVTLDHSFGEVLEACAGPRRRERGTWLGPDMRHAYELLHEAGYAHSLEVWRQGRLIGGLYGVSIGAAFFGESMFSRADNASKIAMVWLCRQLQAWEFDLLDCQVSSPHLGSLGAVEIPRDEFLRRLAVATQPHRARSHWALDIDHPCAAEHLPQ
ncbi:MAG TPA: leucyl/phenylalanyl-tRNA--protein transferase [Fontimonas sp.]